MCSDSVNHLLATGPEYQGKQGMHDKAMLSDSQQQQTDTKKALLTSTKQQVNAY